MPKNNKIKGSRSGKKGMTKASESIMILKSPSGSVNRRNFIVTSMLTTDGSSNLRLSIDLSSTFSIQPDFASLSALFLNLRVHSVSVSIIPTLKFVTVGALAVIPAFAIGYDPSGMALTSFAQVTELNDSLLYAGKRVNFSFTPQLKKQTTVCSEIITNLSNNLGNVLMYNSVGVSANTALAYFSIVLECSFWGQK